MPYSITLIKGDGIGPEISEATLDVIGAVDEKFNLELEIIPVEAGDTCLEKRGTALPDETIETIKGSDACLKAPVGQSAADVIIALRRMLDLYANVRPAVSLPHVDCLHPDIDFVIARENTEDLYGGYEFDVEDGAVAMRVITRKASLRIAEYAFKLAEVREKKKVVAVHKLNVLKKTCRVFAEACRSVSEKHKEISFSEMLVDAAAMNLIREPQNFDVIVTTNLFGDILSDEAAQLTGGLGLAPSGNIGDRFAIFEPVHGSAPDIAGRCVANPISMILSTKMMLQWLSSHRKNEILAEAARSIDEAIKAVLVKRMTTPDIGGSLSTSAAGRAIANQVTASINRKS